MSDQEETPGPYIPKFFEGRIVFITGATGFMGKLLVERLLSACPEVRQIYLLMREKNKMAPEERMEELKQSPVFDTVRSRNPQQLEKLEMVAGDMTLPDLGISAEGLSKLREVSIVFNSAATVRFNEELKTAVNQNLRSVMRLLDLCDKLPSIQVLVHVSTAYCNAEHSVVAERVYPAPMDTHALLQLVDTKDDIDTDFYICPKPNSYTFTKAMAETALVQRGNTRYSIAIFRPSIVVSTLRDPFPGWVENLNGPALVIAGAGTGLLRVSLTRPNARADMVPADLAIDTLLGAAWHTAADRSKEVRVYNCTTGANPTTWRHFEDTLNSQLVLHPFDHAVWYPHITALPNRFWFNILDFLLQKLPQYTAEYVKQLLGKKSRFNLIRTYQKLRVMNEVLAYFSTKEWRFEDGNVRAMRERLSEEDRKIFNLDPRDIDWDDHTMNFVKGLKKYILKEKDEDIPRAKARMRKLRILHIGFQTLLALLFYKSIFRIQYFRQLIFNLINFVLVNMKYILNKI